MALETIATKPFADTARDFIHAWENFDPKRSPLMVAKELAEESPPPEFDDLGIAGLRKVAGLCRELQRLSGPTNVFFLSCRVLAELYAVSHKTGNNWLYLLVKLGVLEEVSKGTLKGRRASEYRYLGEL